MLRKLGLAFFFAFLVAFFIFIAAEFSPHHTAVSATKKTVHSTQTVPFDVLPMQGSVVPTPRAFVASAHPSDLSHGMISFDFDDGFLSAYNVAFPLLEQAGFASTVYIITRSVIGLPAYMTWQDVFNLAAEGNEIGAHTRNHVKLTTVPQAQAEQEILGSKQDLESLGFNVTTFAYPEGDFSPAVERIVEGAGFKGARISQPLLNDPSSDLFALKRQRVETDTTWPEVKKAIDEAIAQHKWVILELHRIDENTPDQVNSSSQLLRQIIQYVRETGIPVVTNDVGIDVLKSQASTTRR